MPKQAEFISAEEIPQLAPSVTVASSSGSPVDPPSKELEADPAVKEPLRRFDFGFLPILPRLRYDPEKPFHFGLGLNIFFGLASTLSEHTRTIDYCIVTDI